MIFERFLEVITVSWSRPVNTSAKRAPTQELFCG
jgi:hypothetical protein